MIFGTNFGENFIQILFKNKKKLRITPQTTKPALPMPEYHSAQT